MTPFFRAQMACVPTAYCLHSDLRRHTHVYEVNARAWNLPAIALIGLALQEQWPRCCCYYSPHSEHLWTTKSTKRAWGCQYACILAGRAHAWCPYLRALLRSQCTEAPSTNRTHNVMTKEWLHQSTQCAVNTTSANRSFSILLLLLSAYGYDVDSDEVFGGGECPIYVHRAFLQCLYVKFCPFSCIKQKETKTNAQKQTVNWDNTWHAHTDLHRSCSAASGTHDATAVLSVCRGRRPLLRRSHRCMWLCASQACLCLIAKPARFPVFSCTKRSRS